MLKVSCWQKSCFLKPCHPVDLSRYIGFEPSTKWQTLRGSYAKVAAAAPSKPTCDDLRGEGYRGKISGKEGLIQQYEAVYLSPGMYYHYQHFFQSSFFTIPCIGFGQVNNDSVKGSPSGKHRLHLASSWCLWGHHKITCHFHSYLLLCSYSYRIKVVLYLIWINLATGCCWLLGHPVQKYILWMNSTWRG